MSDCPINAQPPMPPNIPQTIFASPCPKQARLQAWAVEPTTRDELAALTLVHAEEPNYGCLNATEITSMAT